MGTEGEKTTSAEAEARKTIDGLNARIAELEGTLEKANQALETVQRRDIARTALKGKVADPDFAADMLAPHLRDIEPDKVADHIASEDFKPKLAGFVPAASTPTGDGEAGEGEGTGTAATPPGADGFGGPSPGNDSGTTVANNGGAGQKIRVGSAEYKALLSDPEGMEKARKDGRIAEPARL